MSEQVAFLGLGVIGFPVAGHMAAKGHRVTVYNRTRSKTDAWLAQHKGASAASPAEAAKGASVVFACVGNDDDIREVARAAFAGMSKGSVFVDHTTASATVARELAAEAKARGIGFVDAPVSGGQAGAQNGALTVMCGGSEADFARAKPLIECYARTVRLLGPSGAGQLAKMVNQICIAGVVQGLSEALHFAKRAGLDPLAVVDAISKGAAQSWQMDNRAKTMVEGKFDFGFAVEWMRKDLAIVLDEARKNGARLPLTELVNGFYAEIVAMGGKRWDTSSLIARLDAGR